MDNKRKASASRGPGAAGAGAGTDGDSPPAKRRKLPSDFPNLMKGESPESTTAHGLHFLDAIRRTSDKFGRVVSGYFEKLLPREGNEDYYRKVQMPISLRVIERRLYRQEFANLSELESWLKRMVTNAKEYYNKNTQTFEDAERVRKATSNWMVKFNPAYKKIDNYAATPIPIPPDYDVDLELSLEDMDTETAAGQVVERPQRPRPVHRPSPEAVEEDADGEDEEMPDADADEDADADADADEDAEDDEEGIEDTRASNTRIVLKRRGARARETNTPSTSGNKGTTSYAEVSYQGLSFQKAQEKLIDHLMKYKEDEEDEWPYFEPFVNLPEKTLKDYYQLIENPMSLKKMWRAIQGMQGRGGATGVSLYKSWATMEQEANLLWNNAQYYNEEGSEIYELAGELKDAFYEQLNEAKAYVQEPPQPKIKLRAPSAAQTPVSAPGKPKRITIHVGGGREGSQESPASHAGFSLNSATPQPAVNSSTSRPVPANAPVANLIQSQSPLPPSATALKNEEPARQSPAVPPPMSNGYSSSAFRPVMQPVNGYGQPQPLSVSNGHAPVVFSPPKPLYDIKYRGIGTRRLVPKLQIYPHFANYPGDVKDAILTNLCIRTPLDSNPERRFVFNVPPSPKLLQQNFTINLGPTQWKLQIVPRISTLLEEQQRPYKLFILVNGQVLSRGVPNPREPLQAGELMFDASLHQGVNTISVHMMAALPNGETLPNGSDAVLEKVMVLANVVKQ